MYDISGFGSVISISASNTFSGVPFPATAFADDTDPFDFADLKIGDGAKGVNGDLVVWSSANPIRFTLAFIVGSLEDTALQLILKNNNPSKGKSNAQDVLTISGIYPDGSTFTLTQGKMTNGLPGKSVASGGRIKTRSYGFLFENVIN